ncbi:MAG: RAD55 family ATPase [bacterium]
MEKVKTGITGFDDLTSGIPKGTRTVLYGPSGAGKTVLAMQFLGTGLQNGEVVCYDVFDRPFRYVRRYFKSFGWDIESYKKEGKFVGLQAFPHFDEYEKDPNVTYFTMKHLSDMKKMLDIFNFWVKLSAFLGEFENF